VTSGKYKRVVQQSRTCLNRRELAYENLLKNTIIHPRGLPRNYRNLNLNSLRHDSDSEVGQWLVTVKKRRISPRKRFIGFSKNDVSRQKPAHAYRGNSCLLPFQFQPHLRNLSVLSYCIVRGERSINAIGNAAIPRDENAILNSVCPSSGRGIGFRAAYLTRSRKSWTNHLLFYRRLEYVPQGKPSGPG
jgi:hypothetical protein